MPGSLCWYRQEKGLHAVVVRRAREVYDSFKHAQEVVILQLYFWDASCLKSGDSPQNILGNYLAPHYYSKVLITEARQRPVGRRSNHMGFHLWALLFAVGPVERTFPHLWLWPLHYCYCFSHSKEERRKSTMRFICSSKLEKARQYYLLTS